MRSVPSRSIEPGDRAQMLDHERRILGLDVHAGADRAAADAEIAQIVGGLSMRCDAAIDRARRTRVNSWPSRIGIASCRCVRPLLSTSSNSAPFASSASRSSSNAASELRASASAPSRMAVGITSLVRLRHVDVIVRMHRRVARRAPTEDARWRDSRAPRSRSCCARCRRPPGTRRRRSARDAAPAEDLVGRRDDRVGEPGVEAAGLLVRERRRFLDPDHGGDEHRERTQPADRKVLRRANRLHAVQRVAGTASAPSGSFSVRVAALPCGVSVRCERSRSGIEQSASRLCCTARARRLPGRCRSSAWSGNDTRARASRSPPARCSRAAPRRRACRCR